MPSRTLTKDEVIVKLAELLVGLQVPYSLGPAILGAAGPAWAELWDALPGFGWKDVERVTEELRVLLELDVSTE